MTRKKGRAKQAGSGRTAPSKPRWALIAALGAVVAVAGALAIVFGSRPRRSPTAANPVAFPAPRPARDSQTITSADFIGAERCASCHASEFAAWRRSTHAAAGGTPGAGPGQARVIARFDGTPIRFRDATVIPTATGGRFTFTVRQPGRADVVLRVDGVIGGGHMEGGGTQGFVSRFPDGTYRFLPFDFTRQGNDWFCNTGTRANKGWIPITRDVALADCGDWPPNRVLGDEPRFSNCQSCHGSQIELAFDPTEKTWRTSFTSLAVNCESCHGPGKRHAELMSTGRAAGADIGMRALSTLSKDQSLEVCWQCHALKDQLAPGYLAGKPLDLYYATKLPQLGDAPFHPDGRVRTFAYQQGHLYSDCYLNGSMTCTSCHDPHAQSYRNVSGTALTGRFSNGQCTGCHASKAEPLEAHTKHPPASPGSQCVACHMPYLQQPELGRLVRYARSDHSIPIPRPAFDASLGIESACRTCHMGDSEEKLEADLKARWGAIKPHEPTVAALVRAKDVRDADEIARLVLRPDSRHASALFAGLAQYFESFVRPDMPQIDRDVRDRLVLLAGHADQDVRALALATLHLARGNDPETRTFLAEQLWKGGADDRALRRRWAVILGWAADNFRAKGDAPSAVTSYTKALEISPNDSRVLLNLGLSYADAGQLEQAVEQYRRSLELDARQPLVLVNLGIALQARNDVSGAVAAYREAIAINPNESLAYFNLGNAYLAAGEASAALPFYQRTIALDPGIALAYFYAGRAYAMTGDARRALDMTRRGLSFDPNNEEAKAIAAELEARLGQATK